MNFLTRMLGYIVMQMRDVHFNICFCCIENTATARDIWAEYVKRNAMLQ